MPNYMSMREYSWGMRYTLFQMFFLPYLHAVVWNLIMPEGLNVERNFTLYLINFAVLVPLLHNYLHQSVEHFLKNAIKIILVYEDYYKSKCLDELFGLCPELENDNRFWLLSINEFETLLQLCKSNPDIALKIIQEKDRIETERNYEKRELKQS